MGSPVAIGRIGLLFLLMLLPGCAESGAGVEDASSAASAESLYGPAKIEILPFTKFRSFDEDAIPDGIEVALRPVDSMGDPVKAYGDFQFELFTFRDASAERAGERLEAWSQAIGGLEDQRRFWDRVTSTYVFQLTWEGGEFPQPDRKYVLQASYQGGRGARLFAEHVFEFRVQRQDIRDSIAGGASPPG